MKSALCFLSLLLLAGGFLLAGEQPDDPETCEFTLKGEATEPSITGPDDIVSRVYVIPQPDSPVEIVSIDFEGSFLLLRNQRYRWEPRCKIKVRNRSDQHVEDFHISLRARSFSSRTGGGLSRSSGLAAGQVIEFQACGGTSSGTAPDNYFRILLGINRVGFRGCRYVPSKQIPKTLRLMRIPYRALDAFN